MGVMGTYCQICGLPVQFDHYIPEDHGLYIWRGDGGDDRDPAITFGPEHAWLRRAVGLSFSDGLDAEPPFEGVVQDGLLEGDERDGFVMDGAFDLAAVHHACWDLAGRPPGCDAIEHLRLPEDEEPYRGQLFDFESFVADGHGWMLVDPHEDSPHGRRSRERIVALLRPRTDGPAGVDR